MRNNPGNCTITGGGISSTSYITFVRVVFIMLVVSVQHSLGPYGKAWNFATAPSDVLRIYDILQIIVDTLTMPMLFFISGHLFAILSVEFHKYQGYNVLLLKKVKRLIFPAIVFGVLFCMTLRGDLRLRPISNGFAHLWFLPSLFWCFVIGFFLLKVQSFVGRIISLLSVLVFIYIPLPEYFGWGEFHHFLFFFYFGILIGIYRTQICHLFNNAFFYGTAIFLFSFTLVALVACDHQICSEPFLFGIPYENYSLPILRYLYKIFGLILITITLAKYANCLKIYEMKWYKFLDKTSFGLYIFHMWLMWLAFKCPAMGTFASEYYIMTPILLFVGSSMLSMALTIFVKQIPFCRTLL